MNTPFSSPTSEVPCKESLEVVAARILTFITLGYAALIGISTAVLQLNYLKRDQVRLGELCQIALKRVRLKQDLSHNFHLIYQSTWYDTRAFLEELKRVDDLLRTAGLALETTDRGLKQSTVGLRWWLPILLGQPGRLGNLKTELDLATRQIDAAVRILDHLHQIYLRELITGIYQHMLRLDAKGSNLGSSQGQLSQQSTLRSRRVKGGRRKASTSTGVD